MARRLHEFLPDYEVQHEQDHDVAREQDCVLAVSLVEVVEYRLVELGEKALIGVVKVDVLEILIINETI